MEKIKFIIILHNHQPVGNFDWVFSDAARDAYVPFLDVLEKFPDVKVGLHTTGPLLEWFEENMPEYLDRLSKLVEKGQVEILGGAFYEPILSILPDRDKTGQIDMMNRWIRNRFGSEPAGAWVAERIWEPGFASVLGSTGLKYTTLDNTHFQYAGIPDDNIWGSYVTEDQGIPLRVLPIDYLLRYYIPFHEPLETIDYIGALKNRGVTAVTYADDGEKFGVWPGTKKWVYEKGWLERFFTALQDNAHWIDLILPRDYVEQEPPLGPVYLPTASYKEMSEWALPTDAQKSLVKAEKSFEGDDRFKALQPFIRGSFWRNFLAKYSETNNMYRRMLMVSAQVDKTQRRKVYSDAVRELYMAQCNCGYWHGVFGGLYLNFLRRAIYEHLIKAEKLIGDNVAKIETLDFNGDGYDEIVLSNDKLRLFVAPHEGGAGFELDFYSRAFNIFDTMTRREEAYHSLIPESSDSEPGEHASIHDGIKSKEKDIQKYIHFDWYRRLSFVDHFLSPDENIDAFSDAHYRELGDFVAKPYKVESVNKKSGLNMSLSRHGRIYSDNGEKPMFVKKTFSMPESGSLLKAKYTIEPEGDTDNIVFGVEMNLGLQSGHSDDAFISIPGRTLDETFLASKGVEQNVKSLSMTLEWMPLTVKIHFSQPATLWRLPVETVSQSEGGVEHNYQSTCIMPVWNISDTKNKKFNVEIIMEVE